MADDSSIVCDKCGRMMQSKNFYIYKSGERCTICKQCLTMHIDNFDPSTFLWLLQKFDVPYVKGEWDVLRDRAYARDPFSMNGMSVFGKYLAKMKLKQWQSYNWADSERLSSTPTADERSQQQLEAYHEQLKGMLERGEITEAEYKTRVPTALQRDVNHNVDITPDFLAQAPAPAAPPSPYDNNAVPSQFDRIMGPSNNNPFIQSNFIPEDALPDPAANLTDEDKIYLAMKWGRTYTPSQWVILEEKYSEMMQSFDIHDSDTIGTLVLICKTYLKMNEAIDIGDLNGFNNLSRTYDSLRKSTKFTAAQRKQTSQDFVDSVGQLVAYCEKKKGAIPRHQIKVAHDIFDKVIFDLKQYNLSLINNDPALSRQIEDYLKRREFAQQEKRDKILRALEGTPKEQGIKDQDYIAHYQHIQQQLEYDAKHSGGER